jgi:hypothetical protein
MNAKKVKYDLLQKTAKFNLFNKKYQGLYWLWEWEIIGYLLAEKVKR